MNAAQHGSPFAESAPAAPRLLTDGDSPPSLEVGSPPTGQQLSPHAPEFTPRVTQSPPSAKSESLAAARPYVAFDLEMTRFLPHSQREWELAPPRVTCAASIDQDGVARCYASIMAVTSGMDAGAAASLTAAALRSGEGLAPVMSMLDARALVDDLAAAASRGADLVTWGGSHGDWRVLAQQCGDAAYAKRCAELALASIDIPLLTMAAGGYMMGLRAAARGIGVGDKSCEGSEQAPERWARNAPWERRSVLEHVRNDALLTARVYAQVVATRRLQWVTVKGPTRAANMAAHVVDDDVRGGGARLRTVKECLALPPPKTRYERALSTEPRTLVAWTNAHV